MRLGEGTEPVEEGTDDMIVLDPALCISTTDDGGVDVDALIERVFPNLATRCAEPDTALTRVASSSLRHAQGYGGG